MITNNELLRRLNNLINIGTVHEISENKKLAKVNILGRKTDFFPIVGDANTFKRKATPVRVGEQVSVFCPFGDSNFGFIIAGMFNTNCKEPNGFNENIEISEYQDGTRISYDVSAKELKVDAVKQITVICKSATVQADTVEITATTTHKGDVTIDGNLLVKNGITGQGGITISGGNGGVFNGDIKSTANISDSKGDLTSHSHNTTDGATASSR